MKKKCPECGEMFTGFKCDCGYKMSGVSYNNRVACETCKSTGMVHAYKEVPSKDKTNPFKDYAMFRCLCANGQSRQPIGFNGVQNVGWLQWGADKESQGWRVHK